MKTQSITALSWEPSTSYQETACDAAVGCSKKQRVAKGDHSSGHLEQKKSVANDAQWKSASTERQNSIAGCTEHRSGNEDRQKVEECWQSGFRPACGASIPRQTRIASHLLGEIQTWLLLSTLWVSSQTTTRKVSKEWIITDHHRTRECGSLSKFVRLSSVYCVLYTSCRQP